MALTAVEKIQLALLCDLSRPRRKRVFDFDFVSRALLNDDLWAVRRKYLMPELEAPFPPEVQLVYDTLLMWDEIEDGYGRLGEAEKARVRREAHVGEGPRFPGFFGLRRTAEADPRGWHVDELRIARIFVHDCGDFERYGVGDRLPASSPPVGYGRMLDAWRPIHESLVSRIEADKRVTYLSADEIIRIVRERVEPSKRRLEAGGRWTPTEVVDDTVRHR